jgi:hypothetical protein
MIFEINYELGCCIRLQYYLQAENLSVHSARIEEFHDEIIHLQSQTQKIQQAINDVYKSKKSKKDKKSKKKSKSMKTRNKSNRHHTLIK